MYINDRNDSYLSRAKFRFASSFRNRKLRDCDHGIRKIDERGPETNGTVRSFQLRPRFFKFKFLPLMRRHCVEITHGMSYCKVNICKKEIYL